MKNLRYFVSFLLVAVISSQLFSQEPKLKEEFSPGWAVGIKLTTFGPGLEFVKSFNKYVSMRLGGTYYKMKYEFSLEDDISTINKSITTFGSLNLTADINFLSFMHFTGGLMYNITNLELEAIPKEEYYIGEIEITPETVGSIYYSVAPNKVCPYAGLGFGNSISRSKVVSFAFDFGVVYHGAPKVQLEANGMVSPTASEEQRQILEANIKPYKFYPVVNFQLSFRFL